MLDWMLGAPEALLPPIKRGLFRAAPPRTLITPTIQNRSANQVCRSDDRTPRVALRSGPHQRRSQRFRFQRGKHRTSSVEQRRLWTPAEGHARARAARPADPSAPVLRRPRFSRPARDHRAGTRRLRQNVRPGPVATRTPRPRHRGAWLSAQEDDTQRFVRGLALAVRAPGRPNFGHTLLEGAVPAGLELSPCGWTTSRRVRSTSC